VKGPGADDTGLAPAKERLGLAVLAHALLRIAASADGTLVGLYLAALAHERAGFGAGLAGLLGATAYAAELVGSLPLGMAADFFPVRVLMAAGAVSSALGTGALALVASIPLVFLSRIVQGAGLAAVTPPLLVALAGATRQAPSRRARLMGLFELSMLAGLALGGLVGSQLWVRLRVMGFALLAMLALASAVIFLLAAGDRRPQATPHALHDLRQALENPIVRRLAPVWLCVNGVVGLWLGPTLIFLLTQHDRGAQFLVGLFAATPADVGWLLLGYTAVFAAGVLLWSLVLVPGRLLGSLRTSLYAMLAVCAALFALNHSAHWSAAGRVVLLVITALLIMVESGFTPAALTWLAQALGPVAGKGAAMGVYSVLLGVGAVIGSLLAAALGTVWQIDGLLLGTVGLALLALLLLSWISRLGKSAEAGGHHA
jgi:predicted MFS family arabinose efflux permease